MQSEGIGGEYSQSGLLFMEFMCEKLDSHVYVDPNILHDNRYFLNVRELISDRPILSFYNDTDTDYLHVYVPDNRYSEPIFIYCYKVNE